MHVFVCVRVGKTNNVPLGLWWQEVAKMRPEQQWRGKVALLRGEALPDDPDKETMGKILYAHLNLLGAWSAAPLQEHQHVQGSENAIQFCVNTQDDPVEAFGG